MPPLLGCIADDVTGASDLASALTVGGMRTQLWFGARHNPATIESVDAIVVALKTRSIPKVDAISQSLAALRSLQDCGVTRFLFKYCSTFDSTNEGNIGPVAEALMEALSSTHTLFCPTTPENGRTVYCGHLFVKGKLLNRSGMEKHPLNPMTESDLTLILSRQSKQGVGLVSRETVTRGPSAVVEELQRNVDQKKPLIVIDAIDNSDLRIIADVAVNMPFVTSGSGLGTTLPTAYRRSGRLDSLQSSAPVPSATGNALVLAGSCSEATREQVKCWPSQWPSLPLNVRALVQGELSLAAIHQWATHHLKTSHALIFSSAQPEEVATLQDQLGAERTAAAIEEAMGYVARALISNGLRKLIVAGGETAGAVVQSIGRTHFRIGKAIAPGVPWMETLDEPRLAIALKSGNFGDKHFFRSALEMLP
ncbi:3-oxo-tetronate kinase [Bremerella sp.]|uniref:3-oxo-tetronate kinase n=1 Tax=Bremerella sp. TaxID=2795602 RepID=UPI00391D5112